MVMIREISVLVQAGVPAILWGHPGTGKTATVTAIAEALKWPLEIVIASIREPSDFSGLPVVTDDGVRLVSPAWAIRMASVSHGIIFFDELSCAPPANQAALLRVVNEGWVGETELSTGVSILAASNPPETAAGGWDLPPAQANRFWHGDWRADEEFKARWIRGFLAGFPLPSVPRLPTSWEGLIPQERAILAAFLQKRGNLIMDVPESEAQRGRAWPSPRTWTMAARLGAAANSLGDAELELKLMQGCVGSGPILEFFSWREELDLPDPEELLKDPKQYKHPARGDRAFAILASVVAAFIRKSTQGRWEATWAIIARAVDAGGADTAAIHASTLAKNRGSLDLKPVLKPAGTLVPLLKAAGLI